MKNYNEEFRRRGEIMTLTHANGGPRIVLVLSDVMIDAMGDMNVMVVTEKGEMEEWSAETKFWSPDWKSI